MDILKQKNVKTQKIKGKVYVYIDKPYWDKIKKQNRHERDYIGKLSGDGEFIPNKKYLDRQKKEEGEKKVEKPLISDRKFFGFTQLLNHIGEVTGIKKDLIEIFGEKKANQIMSIAYFLVLEGKSSMYRFSKFGKTHYHPYNNEISSQRISDIFASVTENDKMLFFNKREKRCVEDEYLVYDTTSISSYSETMNQIKYGYNKDLENLPQINLAMVFGEKTMLPIYYRKMPGNINDASTIKKLLIDMKFLDIEKKSKFVLDRGFYSKENINALYKNRYKFVVAGRINSKLIKEVINETSEEVKNFANYNLEHDLYCITKEDRWKYEFKSKKGEKRIENRIIYKHVYYSGTRAEKEKKKFIKKLKKIEEAYINNCLTENQMKNFEKYFIEEKRNEKLYKYNQKAINEEISKFGYFVLLSNSISDASKAITIYRNKDVVEKTFFNLKNRLDMKRVKVRTENTLEGKLFVQFVALIYISYIHQIMLKNNLYKNYTMASLLDEIDLIEIFTYKGKKLHCSEITKKQKDIFNYFNLSIDSTL